MPHEWLQNTCLALHHLYIRESLLFYPADTLDAHPRLGSRGERQTLPQHLPLVRRDPRRFFSPVSAAVRPSVPFRSALFRCINASYYNYICMYFTIKTSLGEPGKLSAAAARVACPGRLFLRAAVAVRL